MSQRGVDWRVGAWLVGWSVMIGGCGVDDEALPDDVAGVVSSALTDGVADPAAFCRASTLNVIIGGSGPKRRTGRAATSCGIEGVQLSIIRADVNGPVRGNDRGGKNTGTAGERPNVRTAAVVSVQFPVIATNINRSVCGNGGRGPDRRDRGDPEGDDCGRGARGSGLAHGSPGCLGRAGP